MMADSYFFLLALPRSGSTVTGYVLDSHSRIHVAHEDNARPFVDHPYRSIYNLDYKIEMGLEDYLDELLEGTAKSTLLNSRYFLPEQVRRIHEMLGAKGRFLVLRRNYMWRAFQRADGTIATVPLEKIRSFREARDMVRLKCPFCEFSYHRLVAEPEAIFTKICRFMGLDFEPQMLDYRREQHDHMIECGNDKAREFTGIVDKSDSEKLSVDMIRKAMSERGMSRFQILRMLWEESGSSLLNIRRLARLLWRI